jgi:type IV fimbrial biogenesis protein FimT
MMPHPIQAGFTFIELVVAIAIAGILLAIGMPSYQTWMENSQTRTAAESLVSGLNLARAQAISLNQTVDFQLTALPGTSWIVIQDSCMGTPPTCPAIETRLSSEGSGRAATATIAGVTVTPVDALTNNLVQFNSLGRMISPTPAGKFTSFNLTNTRLTAANSRSLRVTVDVGGSIRMCDPSITAATDPRYCPPAN